MIRSKTIVGPTESHVMIIVDRSNVEVTSYYVTPNSIFQIYPLKHIK